MTPTAYPITRVASIAFLVALSLVVPPRKSAAQSTQAPARVVVIEQGGTLAPETDGQQTVAMVGSRAIMLSAFRDAYEAAARFYQEAYGGRIQKEDLRGLGVHLQVLQRLIDHEVVVLEAERLGITVTDVQVMAKITTMPAFQSAGKFVGVKRYVEILQAQRPALTHDQFMEAVRFDLTQQALMERVRSRKGTHAEKADAYRAYLDKARANLPVVISPETIARVVDELR